MHRNQLTLATVRIHFGAWAMTLKVPSRIDTGGGRMTTVHILIALVNVHAFRAVRFIARLASAVVPSRHVDAL